MTRDVFTIIVVAAAATTAARTSSRRVYIRPHSGIYTAARCTVQMLTVAALKAFLLPAICHGMDQRPPTHDAYLWASKLGSIVAKEAKRYEAS